MPQVSHEYSQYDEVPEPSDAEIQADIDAKLDSQIAEACEPDPSLPFC